MSGNKNQMPHSCGRCVFFNGEHSECHRYPPVVTFMDNGCVRYSVFPNVMPHQWCGEFRRHGSDDTSST